MEAKGMVRKVDELGRVVLPKAMRTMLGIHTLDKVDIYMEDGKVIIAPLRVVCQCCGKEDNLLSYKSVTLCKGCTDELSEVE